MIYITKQEGLYQNKVNSSLVFTGNCKMDYCACSENITENLLILPKFAPEKRHIIGQYMHIQGYREFNAT